jgi:dolichyl-phosphate-mannose-protein mannosyltransferase
MSRPVIATSWHLRNVDPRGPAGPEFGALPTYDDPVTATLLAEPPTAPIVAVPTLRDRLTPGWPIGGWRGWTGPLAVTALGGVLRFWHLGSPLAVVFDETYYVKDGLALVRYGYEHNAVDNADKILLASNGNWAKVPIFKPQAEYVVHPPVGKWIIGLSQMIFGATPNGWRMLIAVLGTLAILMIARIVRRMTRSNLIGTIAGLLMAIDGMAIVLSRTALLDGVLMFFALAAFGALIIDRDNSRSRYVRLLEHRGIDSIATDFGPVFWWRPWRWLAGICLGLACGVKWSGIYFIVAFGLLTVFWDHGARKTVGVKHPFIGAVLLDGVLSVFSIAVTAVVVYIATWSGWLLTSGGYDRQWAAHRSTSYGFIPAAFRSLWHYHDEAWRFHTNLHTPHSYMSNPWGWQLQARPTSFYFDSPKIGHSGCTATSCSAEVVALGNPLIWWAALIALLHQVWRWGAHRDWRSGAVLAGYLAGWAPWLLWQERTIFTFYAIVYTPFVVMALAMSIGAILESAPALPKPSLSSPAAKRAIGAAVLLLLAVIALFIPIYSGKILSHYAGFALAFLPILVAVAFFSVRAVVSPADDIERRWLNRLLGVGLLLLLFVAFSAYFYPVWSGEVLSYAQWHARMWFPSWV